MRLSRTLPAASVAIAAAAALAVPGVASAQTSSLSAQDRQFLVAAHQSNLAEIAAGTAANASSYASSMVKSDGQTWISDHTTLDKSVQALAAQLGVSLPSTPSAMQRSDLASVEATSSYAAYNAAWVRTELAGHEKTLAAVNAEIANGSNAQVVGAATTAKPIIQAHIADLRSTSTPGSVGAGTGGQAAGGSGATSTGLLAGGALLALGAGTVLVRSRRSTTAR